MKMMVMVLIWTTHLTMGTAYKHHQATLKFLGTSTIDLRAIESKTSNRLTAKRQPRLIQIGINIKELVEVHDRKGLGNDAAQGADLHVPAMLLKAFVQPQQHAHAET